MEYRRQGNGLGTFLEHWGFSVITIFSALVAGVFMELTGTRWIWCYATGLVVAVIGASLIFYAKIPLYRQRRFFTFGSNALPESRRPFYRWGYRFFIFAVVLLSCLLLSKL